MDHITLKKDEKYALECYFTVHMEKFRFFAISDNQTSTCWKSSLPVSKSL